MTRGKKAEGVMGLSFGVIFSIMLIVFFIVIAIIAINYFLNIGKCNQINDFYKDLQEKVDDSWKQQESSDNFKINLPSGIERICFANLSAKITNKGEDYDAINRYDIYEDQNTFLIPTGKACDMSHKRIEHININEIIKNKNPFCVDASKILKIKKYFSDKSVIIE